MGKRGRREQRRPPPSDRWYAVWGPQVQGVYQGWHLAQPASQGIPVAGSAELPDRAAAEQCLAARDARIAAAAAATAAGVTVAAADKGEEAAKTTAAAQTEAGGEGEGSDSRHRSKTEGPQHNLPHAACQTTPATAPAASPRPHPRSDPTPAKEGEWERQRRENAARREAAAQAAAAQAAQRRAAVAAFLDCLERGPKQSRP